MWVRSFSPVPQDAFACSTRLVTLMLAELQFCATAKGAVALDEVF